MASTLSSSHFQWQGDDLILHCHFQPKSSSDDIVGLHSDRLKIRITAPPVDGQANEHIIKWFSKLFKVPKNQIEIVRGDLGRDKTIRIKSPRLVPESFLIQTKI